MSRNLWYSSGTLLMSTGVVSKSLGSTVETNNLNTGTSAKWEAHANAAAPIKDISVAEYGVPEAGVASTGGTKDSVSFGGWNEMLPSTQQIVAGEPAVSQDRQATDIQQSYVERNRLSFT